MNKQPNSKRQGRPIEFDDGRAVNVFLDKTAIKRAEFLGAGRGMSAGIRKALELATQKLEITA